MLRRLLGPGLLALAVAPVAVAKPPALLPTDGLFQIPGIFVTDRGKTLWSQELPSFSSRCYRPTAPLSGGVASKLLKGKPARYSLSGHFETTDGLAVTLTGAYTAGTTGQYSGSGTGTWQATGLPSPCRRGADPTAHGTFAMVWVPTSDGVTERFTFTAFGP